MQKKKDIMDSILDGHHGEVEDRIEQLDCLIYKKDGGSEKDTPDKQKKEVWQTSKENVTVQVWEGKAKIKVKVSPGRKKQISMKRIADIAMKAILEEFNKED